MKTIAQQVAAACAGADCFTLYGGYAMSAGKYKRFPTGRQELEKRNDEGRVSHCRYLYADGSRLVYRWSIANGYTLTAV